MIRPSSPIAGATLDDKWIVESGRIMINGAQAIGRVFLAQAASDRASGLETAGYVRGCRGSPLGNVDTTLWSISRRLEAARITFHPGVNEDLAATAVRGTQQIHAVPGARNGGVFSAWYGKGPGVDRSLDAIKHGNYAGAHRHGGVLLLYGDDHAAKSSTVAHQSEQALSSCLVPSLCPADVQDLFDFGLFGFALSRYSGAWVGIKCVNEVAEQTQTIDVDLRTFSPVLPAHPESSGAIHVRGSTFDPLGNERVAHERRLPLVHAFVRANRIDRTVFRASRPRRGIVTAGKTIGDARAALAMAVARNHAKLLAYKDEYEVARQLTHPALHADLRNTFEDGGRIVFNLAMPMLIGNAPNGRPRKREFSQWTLPLLSVLARMRGLRGTWLDPFGHSTERKAERALIAHYESLVERTLETLTPSNHTEAVALLVLVDQVRGFGPVKEAAMRSYLERASQEERRYLSRSAAIGHREPANEEKVTCT